MVIFGEDVQISLLSLISGIHRKLDFAGDTSEIGKDRLTIMMKIQTSHIDLLERQVREHTTAVPSKEIKSPQAKSVADLEAQLMVCSDEKTRAALVEMLKAQVDAESYHIDSTVLAQKMQGLFIVHATPEVDREDAPQDQ